MSLALKFGDENEEGSVSGAIYFDAVTSYTRNLGGKVSEHPLEAGAFITDHYFSQQPTYNISGIISHIDFTSYPTYNSSVDIDGAEIINKNNMPGNVSVTDNESRLIKFLPDFVKQFTESTILEITGDELERINHSDKIYGMIKDILTGMYYNEERDKFENRMTLMTLFEMDGNNAVNPVKDLVMVKFTTKETPDMSGALIFDMELREINFVDTRKTTAPKTRPRSTEGNRCSSKEDKGNVAPSDGDKAKDKASKNVNFEEVSRKTQQFKY